MQAVLSRLAMFRRLVQELGPYLMLEILLPGGTIIALLLFLFRRRGFDVGRIVPQTTLAARVALLALPEKAISLRSFVGPSQVLVPCRLRVAANDYRVKEGA